MPEISNMNRAVAFERINATERPIRCPYQIILGDALEWMNRQSSNSIHAIVTDPPYGLKEYSDAEKTKLRAGVGGVWRIPPSFDGCKRSPLPRFTVLDKADRLALRMFFSEFSARSLRVLVP